MVNITKTTLNMSKKVNKGTCGQNYRPISLLPAFSKLLEKLVRKRLTSFRETYQILYKHQYGFRKKKLYYSPHLTSPKMHF